MSDREQRSEAVPHFAPSPSEPYVTPERGGITERARARMVPHYLYARAVARKGCPRAASMTDAQLDVDPFVEWVACLFGDFVRKHRDEAQPGEVIVPCLAEATPVEYDLEQLLHVAGCIADQHKPIDPDDNMYAAVPWPLVHRLAAIVGRRRRERAPATSQTILNTLKENDHGQGKAEPHQADQAVDERGRAQAARRAALPEEAKGAGQPRDHVDVRRDVPPAGGVSASDNACKDAESLTSSATDEARTEAKFEQMHAKLAVENIALRKIIVGCADAASGSKIAEWCSVEFMSNVVEEIRLAKANAIRLARFEAFGEAVDEVKAEAEARRSDVISARTAWLRIEDLRSAAKPRRTRSTDSVGPARNHRRKRDE